MTRPRPRRRAWWHICTTRTTTANQNRDRPHATRPDEATPVGWVAVEPRTEYPRLQGLPTVWKGRPDEDKQDDSVWAVTCFVVRKGYRRRGITYALAAAAVGYARANGARALEGYAMLTQPGREITWGELHVGARQVFAEAGLAEVSRPSVRRAVMRIDFEADDSAAAGSVAGGRAESV